MDCYTFCHFGPGNIDLTLQEMSFHGLARDWPYLRWIALQDFVVRLPPQTAVFVLAPAEIQEHGIDTLICAGNYESGEKVMGLLLNRRETA